MLAFCGAVMCVCASGGGCGARLGILRCGRVERRADSEALGPVIRHNVGLLKRVRSGSKGVEFEA